MTALPRVKWALAALSPNAGEIPTAIDMAILRLFQAAIPPDSEWLRPASSGVDGADGKTWIGSQPLPPVVVRRHRGVSVRKWRPMAKLLIELSLPRVLGAASSNS